jgi:hypothetical protein
MSSIALTSYLNSRRNEAIQLLKTTLPEKSNGQKDLHHAQQSVALKGIDSSELVHVENVESELQGVRVIAP